MCIAFAPPTQMGLHSFSRPAWTFGPQLRALVASRELDGLVKKKRWNRKLSFLIAKLPLAALHCVTASV